MYGLRPYLWGPHAGHKPVPHVGRRLRNALKACAGATAARFHGPTAAIPASRWFG